jgi:pimeloyl-ACP methyl ester carboxylesterase
VTTAEEILKLDPGFIFYIPDLPGFGKTPEPPADWRLEDYVSLVKDFIEQAAERDGKFESVGEILAKNVRPQEGVTASKRKRVILVGHSFGGRIALRFAAENPERLEKLVLTGAAGIKHALTPRQRLSSCLSRVGKAIFAMPLPGFLRTRAETILYRLAGVRDYADASLRMKEVMKKVIAEDLTPLLPRIKVPTLLIWGRYDHSTPLADGELMHAKIAGSELAIIEDANHSAVYRNAEEFAEIYRESIRK